MEEKNILFICKHNIFRSRVAEEYLKKISNYNVASAGTILGRRVPDITQKAAQEFELNIPFNPQPLTIELLKKQDKVIIVASDVPPSLFDNPLYETESKLEFWNIDDVRNLFEPDLENNKEIIKIIIKKVDDLKQRLENNGTN